MSKQTIRNLKLEEIISINYDKNNLIVRHTSGSTGIPLNVYIDKNMASIEDVMWRRSNMQRGIKLTDKYATLIIPVDMHPHKGVFMSIGQSLGLINRYYLSIFEDPSILLKSLDDIKPNVIKSFPSCLKILADNYLKNDHYKISPKIILTSGELLEGSVRKYISDTFKSEVYDNYASEEWSQIAWECKEHAGYHINIDNIYVELINKNDEVIGNNEVGEVVCTSLNNRVMPLIRYRMRDMAIRLDDECSCGVKLPLFKVIDGRQDDTLENESGKLISPRVLSDILDEPFNNYQGINQYQIIQEKINRVIINLEVNEKFIGEDRLEKAKQILNDIFGYDTEITFKIVKKIERDKSGKLRKIINKLH
jgi:phenylacetate-CoA ligase